MHSIDQDGAVIVLTIQAAVERQAFLWGIGIIIEIDALPFRTTPRTVQALCIKLAANAPPQ